MVTSHDVAKAAGVSQATVSRALREVPGTSAETIRRVREAAASLGYVPSEAGRTLSTRRTGRIGVVSAELTNPFYPELIEPLRTELERQGYRTLLIPDSTENPLVIDRLADGTLDGVILTTASVDSRLPAELTERQIPFVLVNRTVDGVEADCCVFDNAAGGAAAARTLLELGHVDIAMIAGPATTSTGRDRANSFLAELVAQSIAIPDERVRRGTFSFETGFRGMDELLTSENPPTAVFCGNDVIAIGALNALAARDLSPRDGIGVVGFDDIEMASWPQNQLTTFRCDRIEMAQKSVALLLGRIRDPEAAAKQVVLSTHRVMRTSIGRAKGGGSLGGTTAARAPRSI